MFQWRKGNTMTSFMFLILTSWAAPGSKNMDSAYAIPVTQYTRQSSTI